MTKQSCILGPKCINIFCEIGVIIIVSKSLLFTASSHLHFYATHNFKWVNIIHICLTFHPNNSDFWSAIKTNTVVLSGGWVGQAPTRMFIFFRNCVFCVLLCCFHVSQCLRFFFKWKGGWVALVVFSDFWIFFNFTTPLNKCYSRFETLRFRFQTWHLDIEK